MFLFYLFFYLFIIIAFFFFFFCFFIISGSALLIEEVETKWRPVVHTVKRTFSLFWERGRRFLADSLCEESFNGFRKCWRPFSDISVDLNRRFPSDGPIENVNSMAPAVGILFMGGGGFLFIGGILG